MKKSISYLSLASIVFLSSCAEDVKEVLPKKGSAAVVEDTVSVVIEDPNAMLKDAYQLFKEGDDAASIELANKVLAFGYNTNNDTLIGGALASLCRNSQRSQDTLRLGELSIELANLAETSGNQKWMMIRAHMNAEMWRLIGDMDRAEQFYNESMEISFAIGSMGMFTIDHFNKSFVSTAKGDFVEARRLIKKYYALRKEADPNSEDAYGLIALAYLLEQEGDYEGAHEVACVTRRLFKTQNLFPEPPDEKPLIEVEQSVLKNIDTETYEAIKSESNYLKVTGLLNRYL
jgi:tetratricopeptide (TPR) repeat protein